jgi:hypothetical protein
VIKRAIISTSLFIAIGVAALLVASASHTQPKPAAEASAQVAVP